jgi:2'-5' RNA ligase
MQKFKQSAQKVNTVRCFIAIELDREIKNSIEQYIVPLKRISPAVRWIKTESIHITLKFLGEIEQDLLDKVKLSLKPISEIFHPFVVTILGCGAFPDQRRPRVIWLGIETKEKNELLKLYEWIESRLESLGFKKERRKFSAHLTIGRIKFPRNMESLFNYMDINPFPPKQFLVKEIVLMQSILKSSGAEYKVIAEYN